MKTVILLAIWLASFAGYSEFHADNGLPESNICKVAISTYYYGFAIYAEGDNSRWDTWTMRQDWIPFPNSGGIVILDACHKP